MDKYHLFCIFDGHNGTEAGMHCTNLLYKELHKRLPPGPLPDLTAGDSKANAFCLAIRRAFAETFLQLDMTFAERRVLSGCTATVVLVTGWVAFVANVGDSSCCLDTGKSVEQLNYDHRLEDSEAEQKRVLALGGVLAKLDESGMGPAITNTTGYGPLRVWPGGLALSRAIGDFDVGPCISAMPNIRQVRLPKSGCRMLIASDGLWDAFVTYQGPLEKTRAYNCAAIPEKLIDRALQLRGLADDITIICIDMLPSEDRTIPEVFGAKRGLFCCGAPKTQDDMVLRPSDSFTVLHDEDSSMHGHPAKDAYSGMDRSLFAFGDLLRLPVTLGGQYVDMRAEAAAVAAKRHDASVKGGGYFQQLQDQPARERQATGPNGQQGHSKQFSYHDVSVHMPKNSTWFQQQHGLQPLTPQPTAAAAAAPAAAADQQPEAPASPPEPSAAASNPGTPPSNPMPVPPVSRGPVFVEGKEGRPGGSQSAPNPTLADSDSDHGERSPTEGSLRSDAGILTEVRAPSAAAPFAQIPSEKVGSTPMSGGL